MAFRIKDLPSPGDKVNIRTWPAKLEHLGHRGYEVYNASDELLVAAVSAWTVLDLSTRRLTALPEELAAVYPVNTIPCHPLPVPYHPTGARWRGAPTCWYGATTSTSTDMSTTQSTLGGCLSVCRGPPVKASSRPCST